MESIREKTVIVTGGAGYLGRCTVEVLRQRGFHPIVLDNFMTSSRKSVDGIESIEVDLTRIEESRGAFKKHKGAFGVIHFAALALVEESVRRPDIYLHNNVEAAKTVARLSEEFGIDRVIHSSSCAVYGHPANTPISENTALSPVSPYGTSKVLAEKVFDESRSNGRVRSVNLRYFNPAGSVAGFGERHEPETHLIPRVVDAISNGKPVELFGSDYSTSDGTCVRDFIHVKDLVDGHLKALEWLSLPVSTDKPTALNLGSGRGFSVLEVIGTAERVLGRRAERSFLPRRKGDPAKLVADTRLAQTVLNWNPLRELHEMILDHFNFMKAGR